MMRITLFTDYSLRVLVYLGLHAQRLATIGEIARSYGISRNHLMKVVGDLQQNGYIQTLRGRGGGMRLRRDPADINLGQVVRQAEQDLALMECHKDERACLITAHCELRFVLDEALAGFFVVLDRYTLADLLQSERAAGLRCVLSGPVVIEAAQRAAVASYSD